MWSVGMSLIYSLPLIFFDIRDKWILLFPLSRLEYLFQFKRDSESCSRIFTSGWNGNRIWIMKTRIENVWLFRVITKVKVIFFSFNGLRAQPHVRTCVLRVSDHTNRLDGEWQECCKTRLVTLRLQVVKLGVLLMGLCGVGHITLYLIDGFWKGTFVAP